MEWHCLTDKGLLDVVDGSVLSQIPTLALK